MPVPTWDCPELVLLDDQPVDVTTTTVVSEDIWKKFDLDFPQHLSLDTTTGYYRYNGGSSSSIEDGIMPDPYENRSTSLSVYEKDTGSISSSSFSPLSSSLSLSLSSSRLEAREIRHHDCMWAGLCISKEHNRTHPAKKKDMHNNQMIKKSVPAGRSLLINRKQPAICNPVTNTSSNVNKNLESDGDSTRPETPQSCESESDEEDDDDEDEDDDDESDEEAEMIPRFKHDSISLNDKLSEYVHVVGNTAGDINSVTTGVPVSEVTGQLAVSRKIIGFNMRNGQQQQQQQNIIKYVRKDNSSNVKNSKNNFYTNGNNNNNNNRHDFNRPTNPIYTKNNNNNNCSTNIVSLGDHCYHLNQTSSSKKLEHLGVQTPSDSEEEIDVVTFDKPSCRPASLPTNPSLADKQHLQKTVTSALKDKSPPRPRGRPPSSNTPRKRSAQNETATKKPAKRPKHKTMSYQKRSSNNNNNNNNNKIGNTTINNNNNSNSNNNNNNIINNNKNLDKDENCCNSRVMIGKDFNDLNDDGGGGDGEIIGDNNYLKDRRRGGENSGNLSSTSSSSFSSSSFSSSSSSKDINKLSNMTGATTTTTTTTTITSSSTCSRSTSSDDEPDTEKRSLHNNMERQRRIELRNAFEELRVLVPEVEKKEKAPKVVILRQAAVYCDMLTEIGQNTLATVNELKRRQDKLRTKLSQLRRNLRSEWRGSSEVRNSNHHDRRTAGGVGGSGLQG